MTMAYPRAKRRPSEVEDAEEDESPPILVTTRSVCKDGRYQSPWSGTSLPSFMDTLLWKMDMNDQSNIPSPEVSQTSREIFRNPLRENYPSRPFYAAFILELELFHSQGGEMSKR